MMLVLTRKKGEAMYIGQGIEVTVLEIQGDRIKLGIEAPADIEIFRKEVMDRIRLQNQEALNLDVKKLPKIQL